AGDRERRRRAARGHGHGPRILAADGAVAGDARELDGVTQRGEPAVGGARVDPQAAALAAVHGDGVAVGVEVLPGCRGGDGQVPGRGGAGVMLNGTLGSTGAALPNAAVRV